MPKEVTFVIQRFDPERDKAPYFKTYSVPWERKDLTVLEGLYYVLENVDGSLAFRASCRGAICGSCAMHINGKHRLACNTLVSRLGSDKVTIRPLSHLKIEKDLCVEMKPFWEKFEFVKPYLMPGSPPPPSGERVQTQDQREELNVVIDCIQCGCCFSACPVTLTSKEYLGPAALLKLDRFVRDSRDGAGQERLGLADGPYGAFRCHNVFNCQCCPKELDPPRSIAHIKRRLLKKRLLGS
jgi:succinate dehydrogenase / fumarate reductase iron-sulfur subunit